jgi:2-deoxy-D-gluconate 3-dehydrogenase
MILDTFNLKGKSGLVTGGGSGIGKGMALGLAEAGAEVIVAGRNIERLNEVAHGFGDGGGRIIPVTVDMKYKESIQALVDRTIAEFGKIDFLFNNAGTIHRFPSEEFPKEAWDEGIQVNLTGPFLLSQAVARVMIEKGTRGKIVNTSSLIAVLGGKTVRPMPPAKAALRK